MAEFQLRVQNGILILGGHIDGPVDPRPLPALGQNVTLNFRQVTGITSAGVSGLLDFIFWLGERKLVYDECPTEIVNAFTMLPALLGRDENPALVQSFFGAFECTRCVSETLVLIATNEIRVKKTDRSSPHVLEKNLRLPTRACPRCGVDMQCDEHVLMQIVDLIAAKAIIPVEI